MTSFKASLFPCKANCIVATGRFSYQFASPVTKPFLAELKIGFKYAESPVVINISTPANTLLSLPFPAIESPYSPV